MRPSKSACTSGDDPCRCRNSAACARAYGNRTLKTKSMGVVVPSISKRIARTDSSPDRVTTELQPGARNKKVPGTPAGSCDQPHYRCSAVSSLTGLETNGSHGLFGLRRDQTSARFHAGHKSNLQTPPQLWSAALGAGGCETIRGHG